MPSELSAEKCPTCANHFVLLSSNLTDWVQGLAWWCQQSFLLLGNQNGMEERPVLTAPGYPGYDFISRNHGLIQMPGGKLVCFFTFLLSCFLVLLPSNTYWNTLHWSWCVFTKARTEGGALCLSLVTWKWPFCLIGPLGCSMCCWYKNPVNKQQENKWADWQTVKHTLHCSKCSLLKSAWSTLLTFLSSSVYLI